MKRADRWNRILETIGTHGVVDVESTAALLDVSTATIRRDLDELAQQQMVVRTRGGAVSHSVSYDLPLRYKSSRQASEKQRIAQAAAELVTDGSIVGINGGTTTTEVARALALKTGEPDVHGRSLTIVTNALNISSELAVRTNIKIVSTGGVPHPHSYELIGPYARHVLEQIHVDVAIIGVDAIDAVHGLTGHNEDESIINSLMIERASSVIVVADHTKLGKRAFSQICGIDAVDVMVTDSEAPDDVIERFRATGVRVVLA
ncbi:DeoR/GlpR family DNA-binding transcription regulator [Herbiconiux daphne]|uniref:DeoR/GlpR family DNA-binding transcription regulator n=1 Tax=Herbiconiux daphne TaxID=2970914 RepID=A0ABT2GW49_9MICO|nr:DeoR/GlpR family DNA-binding transcription regulator [Herbiconiux daphne]MCS5732186.1 DeoR/GlpR family DNA-binding transcription regulator [Herbiconiux daphne]